MIKAVNAMLFSTALLGDKRPTCKVHIPWLTQ